MTGWLKRLLGRESERAREVRQKLESDYTESLDGVRGVRSPDKHSIEVVLADPLDVEEMADIIREAGYDAEVDEDRHGQSVGIYDVTEFDDGGTMRTLEGVFRDRQAVPFQGSFEDSRPLRYRLLVHYLRRKYGGDAC